MEESVHRGGHSLNVELFQVWLSARHRRHWGWLLTIGRGNVCTQVCIFWLTLEFHVAVVEVLLERLLLPVLQAVQTTMRRSAKYEAAKAALRAAQQRARLTALAQEGAEEEGEEGDQAQETGQ